MKESQDPMIPRKMELDKNPHGHTMIFIKDGENAEKKITAFLEKINKRPLRWN